MHIYYYTYYSSEAKSTNVGLISKSGDFRLDQLLRGQNTDGNLNLNFLLCIPVRLERRNLSFESRTAFLCLSSSIFSGSERNDSDENFDKLDVSD